MRTGDRVAGGFAFSLICYDRIFPSDPDICCCDRADIVCHWEDSDVVAQEMYYNVRRDEYYFHLPTDIPRLISAFRFHVAGFPHLHMYRPRYFLISTW